MFAEPLLDHGGEYKMAQAFSELTIDTRESSLTLDAAGGKGLRAGDRALNAETVLGSKSLRLYDLIYRGGWTLLAFTGTGAIHEASSLLKAGLEFAKMVSTFIVSADSRLENEETVLYDLDEEAHRVYGVRRPTLILIRPDGHIGARVKLAQVKQLEAYMARWVPDASQRFSPLVTVHSSPQGAARSSRIP